MPSITETLFATFKNSKVLESWEDLNQKYKDLSQEYKDLSQENKDLVQKNKLLRNKLEFYKYRYPNDKRRWVVNGNIENESRNNVYFVDLEETNVPLLDMILKGEFVTLYGARASGKSTRVDQVMEKLKSQGIICIYVTLEQINMETKDSFWSSMGFALHISAPKYFGKADVKSSGDFRLKFLKEQWNDNRVVLFIDEFDILFEAHDDIKSSFFEVIHAIKNTKENYALLSSVAIGLFSILRLSSDRITTSPFNINNPFRNPNFTLEQVQSVYKEFEDDFKLTIDPEIIEDIYNRTNGHAALVCLCGKAINSDLMSKLDENRRLTSLTWLNFVINSMQDTIFDYNTFRWMIIILQKKKVRPAIELLRSVFLGSFKFVPIYDSEEKKLAEFLTAEGVLMRDETKKNNFRMSSIFVDDLIQRRLIPALYKSAPTCAVPLKKNDTLDILKILQTAIRFFDKDIISNAFIKSFKVASTLYVDGQKETQVPQENVYNTELIRILVNWLVRNNGFEVTGQWHMVESHAKKHVHTYSDIVITTQRQRIVLELLATATKEDLDEHFERVLEYAEKLSADDIWIVHFTCEDRYATATHKKLHWPPDDRINVIHCFHNRILENVLINVRYVDSSGTIKYITDEAIPLNLS
ncbi:P-loop containing nucleoside triphosphate hydrolase protein [Rhizophagus irregularis DAOM 181602=DAOM 197198]|nr:P-loop containing nucleoside triphosphate hydrolase protein [Rhizophagus irregularis DAOM 181602=DAOM 197198]